MLSAQQICQLDQADVLLRRHRRKDHVAERLNTMRACVATLGLGFDATCRVDGLYPAYGAGDRDAEPLCRATAGHALRYGGNQSGAKIDGQCLTHTDWPPDQSAW